MAYLHKTNTDINVSTVANRARDDPPPSTRRDTSILAAMRNRLAAKETEIKQLKATVAAQKTTIELLYGQIELLTERPI